MAQQTITTVVDDLTGEALDPENYTEVEFVIDGQWRTMDLGPKSLAKWEKAVKEFMENSTLKQRVNLSRLAGAPAHRGDAGRRPPTNRAHNQAVREWALKNGMQVSERGRIPGEVLEAFEQNH